LHPEGASVDHPQVNSNIPSATVKDRCTAAPTVSGRITVLMVDDHPLLREGIAAVIEGQPDMLLVGEAANGAEALEKFRAHRPEITLMDLQMPGMSGTETIRAIRKEFPAARFIVLTTYEGDASAVDAIRAGAAGYLLKSALRAELIDTIHDVFAGKRRIPAEVAAEIAVHAGDEALSEREIDVLRHVAQGNGNKQVAIELAISVQTVKGHMKNILLKLQGPSASLMTTAAMAIRRTRSANPGR
jgi:DNA-binding NarL/FixJ family response regulator